MEKTGCPKKNHNVSSHVTVYLATIYLLSAHCSVFGVSCTENVCVTEDEPFSQR